MSDTQDTGMPTPDSKLKTLNRRWLSGELQFRQHLSIGSRVGQS